MEWWLCGFLGVEGLDMRFYWGFWGKKMRGALHCALRAPVGMTARTGNGEEQEQATTKNKNRQRRNAGVPPLRRQSAPPPVGMTVVWGAPPPVGMTARTGNGEEQEQATTKNKNRQRRNAGVPPLRRQSAPPAVGMTVVWGAPPAVGMTGNRLRAAGGMTKLRWNPTHRDSAAMNGAPGNVLGKVCTSVRDSLGG
jgi:hypothetical protein